MSQNVVGPRIRQIRSSHGWTQEVLTAKCNVFGWDISRGTLAKVEAGVRRVTDAELYVLAGCLNVEIASLYPSKKAVVESLI